MGGSNPVGPPKTKCLKGKDGSFSWSKDLGTCEGADEEDDGEGPSEGEKPDGEKPDGEKPDDEEDYEEDDEKPDGEKPEGEKPDDEEDDEEKPEGEEGEKPEGPAPVGEAGKWQKCEELMGVMGGVIECAGDTCVLSCDDGSDVADGSSKTKCLKGKDGSFSWTKDLGNCGMMMEDNEEKPDDEKPEDEKPEDDEEKPDDEKPDDEKPEDDEEGEKPEGPAPVGEDGKWQKCEELKGVMGGTIECAVDTCLLACDDGSDVVDGSSKTKCIKNKDKTFTWSKDLGNCGITMDDDEDEKPEDEKPDDEKPEDEEKPDAPAPVGEDGKWQKCEELQGVMGGSIECSVDTCLLACDDGSDVVDGSAKTKCIKNKDKTFSWSK